MSTPNGRRSESPSIGSMAGDTPLPERRSATLGTLCLATLCQDELEEAVSPACGNYVYVQLSASYGSLSSLEHTRLLCRTFCCACRRLGLPLCLWNRRGKGPDRQCDTGAAASPSPAWAAPSRCSSC